MTLTDITLSNAKRFHSSMGNPLAVKGLKVLGLKRGEGVSIRPYGALLTTCLSGRYAVMLRCWKANPQERTTFDEMSEELHQMYQQTTVGFKYLTKLIT